MGALFLRQEMHAKNMRRNIETAKEKTRIFLRKEKA